MQHLTHLVDPILLAAASGAIAVLLVMWLIVRSRRVAVPPGMLVLPHIEMARTRNRLAAGSVGYPTGEPEAPARRTPRPSHAARRSV